MYNKLSIWRLDDAYDLILFLDADGYASGHVESVLDIFEAAEAESRNSKGIVALLGAVKDGNSAFNAGVMVLRPNSTTFDEMLSAAETTSDYRASFAEQAFLAAFAGGRSQNARWVALPQVCLGNCSRSCAVVQAVLADSDTERHWGSV